MPGAVLVDDGLRVRAASAAERARWPSHPDQSHQAGVAMTDVISELPAVRAQDLDAHLETTRGLERSWIQELIESRRKAWRLTYAALAISALSVVAVASLAPLKSPPEVAVVRVDHATGAVEHVSRLGDAVEDYGDRIARYFIAEYVQACEGYDWWLVQQQYETCGLMSSPEVQRQYGARWQGDTAPDKRLRNHARYNIAIRSITPGTKGNAVVRFSRREDPVDGRPGQPEHLVATLAYQYINAPLKTAESMLNPLGFQVMTYQVDPEFLSR